MTFQERYQYNPRADLLGKGGFARVYKANDVLLDREVAIKVFSANDKDNYTVVEEIKKATRLHHPNLLRYYDVAVLESTNAMGEKESMQIGVMEYANAGDLKQFARKNPNSPLIFTLLQQVLSGLSYLHQKGIIHRDLKPQNILLVEEEGELTAKISDFGISKNAEAATNSSSLVIGTIEYMAPEQFSPQKYGINGKISTNVDLWSFGIMVHELIRQQPLFGQRSGNITAEQIMNSILSSSLPPDVDELPEPYRAVVKKCLVADAKQRIRHANELVDMFKHRETAVPYEADQNAETRVYHFNHKNDQETKEDTAVTRVLEPVKPKQTPIRPTVAEEVDQADVKGQVAGRPRKKMGWVLMIIGIVIAGIVAFFVTHKSQNAVLAQADQSESMKADTAKTDSSTLKIPEAVEELQLCANNGNADCAYRLGMIYYEGKKAQQDLSKALTLFESASQKGDSKAQCMLGNMYFMGIGVKKNYAQALPYYFKSAENGNTVAMYALGLAFANGGGVVEDKNEARKWFQQVIDKSDNPEAVKAAKEQMSSISK